MEEPAIDPQRSASDPSRSSAMPPHLRAALLGITLDCVGASVCVLDEQGVIQWTNQPWVEFATRNGGEMPECGVGANYLAACGSSDDGFVAELRRVVCGELAAAEAEYPCHSPIEPRWFHVQARATEDRGRRWTVLVHRDVTAIHVAAQERAALEANMQRLQGLESAGLLASGLAHDFKNVLTTILGSVGLARMQVGQPDQVDPLLRDIEAASRRARDLVERMSELSRMRPRRLQVVELAELTHEVVSLQRRIAPPSVRFDITGLTSLRLQGDPQQLHQVWMNLLTNAWQAMAGRGGTVHVELTTSELGPNDAVWFPGVQPGIYATVHVRDDGCGIAPSVMPHLFEPFHSTKPTQPGVLGGTGLGLATSLAIVRAHGGAIGVISAPGRGSTFSIYLPCARSDAMGTGSGAWLQPLPRRT